MNTFYITGALLLTLFCYDNWLLFRSTSAQLQKKHNIDNLSNNTDDKLRKSIAYILSIRASIVMFTIGVISNVVLYLNGGNFMDYTSSCTGNNLANGFQILGVLYFTSYLIMDIVLGKIYYHEHMCSLSGYAHHIGYLFINWLTVHYSMYSVFLLYMIEELPTIILSLGSFDKIYRNNTAFGLTFLLTRILYHAIVTIAIIFAPNDGIRGSALSNRYIILFFASLTLALHVYWFRGWLQKYGPAPFRSEKNKRE